MDQQFAPIEEFKKRLQAKGVTAQNVISISGSTSKSASPPLDIKTIEDITENFEKGRAWILCKIIGFEHHGPWCYTSCKKCSRKLNPVNGSYTCDSCNLIGFVMRYRIKVRLFDGTGNLTLMLWDKHCIPLFGEKAEHFLKETGDDSEIPHMFKTIIDQPLLLELDVRKSDSSFYEKIYSVQ